MAMVDKETPAGKPEAGKDEARVTSSDANSTPGDPAPEKSPAKAALSSKDFILSVARKISEQSLQSFEPGVWGVLTAISGNARKRPQGMNILLDGNEHFLGRLVDDPRFQIEGLAVSARHCKICRSEDLDLPSSFSVFLKDNSTNGTYLNWEKVTKHIPEVRMQHGDIISFVAPPHHDLALAFVYREVCKTTCLRNGTTPKRKQEEFGSESKRLKGLGIGAPEGPISLDDVRSLQRSNMELRKELESHVNAIETMRSENWAIVARHEQEMKVLKETVSQSFSDQIKELRDRLEIKQKEFIEVSAAAAERQQAMEDLNERLSASVQSRTDADEIINSQKATLTELEAQLVEERSQRREEREKAVADHKSALEKLKSEVQEELKTQSAAALKQQKELQEVISKLQESDRESRALVETLRLKLEDTRESFVISEKKVRQLEAQVHEEQLAAANAKRKAEAMEMETKKLRKEVESEKVAREEAWAKVSALELEISSAIRDLSIEKQRYQGARERIILRETQLRSFYSTTEEITALFAKQQEQLKAMQKALEDDENYENASVDIDLSTIKDNLTGALARERTNAQLRGNTSKGTSTASIPNKEQVGSRTNSDDDGSDTVKHDCNHQSHDEGETQEMDCTSADRSVKGFGSDIDGVDKAPVPNVDLNDTERLIVSESEVHGEHNFTLRKCSNLGGDTMQLDVEAQDLEVEEHQRGEQGNNQGEGIKDLEDTEVGTIRTADLLTSEVAGSWAVNTASEHGENESPRSGNEAVGMHLCFSNVQAAGSQTKPAMVAAASDLSQERRALNQMIGIVAPDMRDRFPVEAGRDALESESETETEVGSTSSGDRDGMDDDDDATQLDSVA